MFKISGIIGISIAFSIFPVLKGLRRVLFHQIFYDVFIHRLTHSIPMSSFFQCFPVLFLAFAAEYQKSLQYLGKLVWSRLATVKSLHIQKKFPLKFCTVNVTRSAVSSRFGRIYWRNLLKNFVLWLSCMIIKVIQFNFTIVLLEVGSF